MKLIAHTAVSRKTTPRGWRPSREIAAFSLTEVVIAMGVAAVAFTTIIGLFPLGLGMSKDSYESTLAALIAQTIMADMKDQQTGTGNRRTANSPFNTKLIQVGPNSDPILVLTNYVTIAMNSLNPETAYIAYRSYLGPGNDTDPNNPPMVRPAAGQISPTPPRWYTDTNGSNGCIAMVKVTLSPTLRFGNASSTSGPRRVDISVETPGTAGPTNRTYYLFTGVLRP